MKNGQALLCAFLILFSLGCFAQRMASLPAATSGTTVLLTDKLSSDSDYVIKSYYVEERINKLFGGRITT